MVLKHQEQGQNGMSISVQNMAMTMWTGKPEGDYAMIPPQGDRGLERQNESADVLAEQGYRTIMLDELPNGNGFGGNGYGIDPKKSPDFII